MLTHSRASEGAEGAMKSLEHTVYKSFRLGTSGVKKEVEELRETHVCPISCAMVKAVARPMSSLMLQLLSGSHIPPTGARPDTDTRVHMGTVTWTHTCTYMLLYYPLYFLLLQTVFQLF